MQSLLDVETGSPLSSLPNRRSGRSQRALSETTRSADCQGFQRSESDTMRSDQADVHWLYTETIRRLDSYQERVHEGRDYDAALFFARYILWSRLDRILQAFNTPGPLKVDSAFLRWKAEELQRTVQDAYAFGKASPSSAESVLESIHRKLDLLAGHVAQMRPAANCNTVSPRAGSSLGVCGSVRRERRAKRRHGG